jgi:23S rRNA (pseudouridine1915-N3)-methyltransferase
MKLTLLTVSHKQPDWVNHGWHEYQRRLPREWSLQLVEIKPDKRLGGKTAEQGMQTERDRLQAALPADAYLIALDERGSQWTTRQLADHMRQWQTRHREVVFIIGGADGLHPDIKQRAHQLLQLSALTLPHGLVRILLAEQLYRGVTLLNNHPYHRE